MPAKKKAVPAKASGAKRPSSPPSARKSASAAGGITKSKASAAATRVRTNAKGGAAASRGPAAASSSSLPETLPAIPGKKLSPGLDLAKAIAEAADSKKAESIRILDVRGLSMITDFYVIASGSSAPHLRAIRNEVEDRMREERQEKAHSAQGLAESQWLLLDYGDVVVHIFNEEKRELYALEDLWSDAPRVDWADRA